MDAIATAPVRNECRLIFLPPEQVAAAWPVIEPLVPSVIERSNGRVSLETLLTEVREGLLKLWIVWDGDEVRALIGVEVGYAPTGLKIATVNFASGSGSGDWIYLIEELEDHMRAVGCKKLEMWARKGWARKLPQYKMSHIFLERDL